MPAKNAVGRPRLYANKEEAKRVDLEKRQQRRQRQQQQQRGPADFIAYEPLPPSDIPITTRPEIALRTSPDVRIPIDGNSRESNVDETDTQEGALCQATPAAQATQLRAEEDAEIARQVKEIRKSEQENGAEQEEYEARVTAQMTAADYEAADTLRALQTRSEERQGSVGASS